MGKWLFAITSCCLLLIFTLPLNATPLNLAQSKWAPYVMDSPIGKGIAHDIVTLALTHSGYTFSYEEKPWSRVLKETYHGKNDIIIALWQNDERRRDYYFTESYLTNTLSVISRAESVSFDYQNLLSLNGKKIAIIDNYAYPPELLQYPGIIKITSANLETSMRLLLSNRVDIVIGDEFVARWTIKEISLPSERFRFHTIAFQTIPLFAAVRKNHPNAKQIIDNLNHYFRQISSSQLQQLKLKYGLMDTNQH